MYWCGLPRYSAPPAAKVATEVLSFIDVSAMSVQQICAEGPLVLEVERRVHITIFRPRNGAREAN